MRKIKTIISNEIKVENIKGYFERKVTKFGTGAKIDCPKEYLGEKVIILVKKKRASKTE
jgi:putative transposon-encoded protein